MITLKEKNMNRTRLYINIKLLLLAVLTLNLSGCELDERVDDLTGGYEGAFIDRLTGEKVATEYYGAKLKLLDLEYGNVAVPLEYNTLPEGTYRNTKYILHAIKYGRMDHSLN